MKDKNGKQINQEDVIRGRFYGLGEATIHTAIVRWGDEQWNDWDLDTVEVVGNLKDGIQS